MCWCSPTSNSLRRSSVGRRVGDGRRRWPGGEAYGWTHGRRTRAPNELCSGTTTGCADGAPTLRRRAVERVTAELHTNPLDTLGVSLREDRGHHGVDRRLPFLRIDEVWHP